MEILDEVHQSSLVSQVEHCLEQGFSKEMSNIAQVAIINVNPMHLW